MRTSLYGRLVDKYLEFTRWPTSRKTAISGVLAYPIYFLFYWVAAYGHRSGWGGGIIDLGLLERVSRIWVTISPFITIGAIIEARRGREGRWTAYAFVLAGGPMLLAPVQFFGTVSTSLVTVIPMTILFITLFFDTRVGWFAFIWHQFLFLGVAVIELSGMVPYAPLLISRDLHAHAGLVYQGLLLLTIWIVFANLFLRVQFTASIRARQMEILKRTHRELKEAKDKLARSEALSAVATLASGAAHEIRNPLASSHALIQSLKEDLELDDIPASLKSILADNTADVAAQIDSAAKSIDGIHRLLDDVEQAQKTGRERETLDSLGVSLSAEAAPAGATDSSQLGKLGVWLAEVITWPLVKRAALEAVIGGAALALAWLALLLFGSPGTGNLTLYTGLWALACGLLATWLYRGANRPWHSSRGAVHLLHAVHMVFAFILCGQLGGMSTPFYAMLPGWVLVASLMYDARVGLVAFGFWMSGSAMLAALEVSGTVPYAPAMAGWTVDSYRSAGTYLFLLSVYLGSFTGVFLFVQASERLRSLQEARITRANRELTDAREALARSEALSALGALVGRSVKSVGPPVRSAGDALARMETAISGDDAVALPVKNNLLATIRMAGRGQKRAERILDRLGMLLDLAGRDPGTCSLRDVMPDLANRFSAARFEQTDDLVRSAAIAADELVLLAGELVENAVRSGTRVPPVVSLRTNDSAGSFEMTVTDTGSGIPDRLKPLLFKPFASGDRAGEGHGVGLGLYLVHEIVRRNGGSVEVATAEGRGTTVTIRLPQAAA